MSDNTVIKLQAGSDTEALLQKVLDEIESEGLECEVEREFAQTDGLASEPITTAVVFVSVGGAVVYAIARGVEKYLENRRQEEARKILLQGLKVSTDAGKVLLELEKRHSDVIQSQGIPQMKPHDTSVAGHKRADGEAKEKGQPRDKKEAEEDNKEKGQAKVGDDAEEKK